MVYAAELDECRRLDRRVKEPRFVDEFVEWAWQDDDPGSELHELQQERARALLADMGGDL